MLNIYERAAFIAMPSFLAEKAETQFRTNLRRASRYEGIRCSPKAIQQLLPTCAAALAIRKVLEDLRNITWGESEVEEDYRKIVNLAAFRCGNVENEDRKIDLYVDGLSNTIRTVVARYRESVHRCELASKSLAHFVKSED